MLVSLDWLREFVPYQGTAAELGDRLTMLGLELEGIHAPYAGIVGLVVGRVLTCDNHPDSDHLHVCTVDVGEAEPLGIVCGAPNVAAGQLVPVARVGTIMPGGLEIKKAKLRGVPSHGMICSERELGLSDEHAGILVLPEATRFGERVVPGMAVSRALDLDGEIMEISVTPNRADCLSILGIAREVAAAYGLPLRLPVADIRESGADVSGEIPIAIADAEFCPAYTGRVLEGARVMPSPPWLRYRLHAAGVRPLSNLVDVTNYVLLELGQPLHAFDRDKLASGRITVSGASEGETLVTLDGQERALKPGDGLIRDGETPVALAGVMGGLATEITAESRSVFLECALFRPASIRRTARRLGLSSESSYRFERGVDQTGMDFARDRAAALMAELSGGTIRKGVCRAEPKPWQAPIVRFRRSRAEDLLGVPLDADECARVLGALGCTVDRSDEADWRVAAPGWRYDMSREADLIEEVARFLGVDTLPATLPVVARDLDRFGLPEGRYDFLSRVKHWASGLGLNEAINYSFVGHKDLDLLNLPREGRVSVLNPLTAEQDVLRPVLAPGLLADVRHNIAQGAQGLRLFEVAQSFLADPDGETTVAERRLLGIALYGARFDASWPQPEADMDYTDLKGLVERFFQFLHLDAPVFSTLPEHPYLAPAVRLTCNGLAAGTLGRVKPDIADAYHARKDVWLAECDLDTLREAAEGRRVRFAPLPVFPPVRRDVTVIAPNGAGGGPRVDDLLAALRASASELLESVELRDVYEPAHAAERNLTFRLTFRHAERTLQDAEVDREREKIVSALVRALPVRV